MFLLDDGGTAHGLGGRALGVGIVAVALAGCPSNASPTLQQACANYASAFRTYETHCYEVPPEGNRTTLEQRETQACVLESNAPGSHLGASFWQGVADLISNANVDCSGYGYEDAPGSLTTGAPCFVAEQCASLWCAHTAVDDDAGAALPDAGQCGSCATRLGAGAPCTYGTDVCEFGLSCFDGACQSPGSRGGACAHWSDCASPLVCRSTDTCGDVLALGQPCGGSTDCGTDQGCDPDTRVCVPFVYALAGQSCDGDTKRCERGSCITTTGVCPAVLADGSPCDPNVTTTLCDTYASCFGGTCQIVDPARCP